MPTIRDTDFDGLFRRVRSVTQHVNFALREKLFTRPSLLPEAKFRRKLENIDLILKRASQAAAKFMTALSAAFDITIPGFLKTENCAELTMRCETFEKAMLDVQKTMRKHDRLAREHSEHFTKKVLRDSANCKATIGRSLEIIRLVRRESVRQHKDEKIDTASGEQGNKLVGEQDDIEAKIDSLGTALERVHINNEQKEEHCDEEMKDASALTGARVVTCAPLRYRRVLISSLI